MSISLKNKKKSIKYITVDPNVLCRLVGKPRKTVATYFRRNELDLYSIDEWRNYLKKYLCGIDK